MSPAIPWQRAVLLAGAAALGMLPQPGHAAGAAEPQLPQPAVQRTLQDQSLIASLPGDTLTAVDGSTLRFTLNDDGATRHIVSADGSEQATVFVFLNRSLGTVRDAAGSDVTGFFRRTDSGIELTYADGRLETVVLRADGGVEMTLHTPGGAAACMGWYPKGHAFSDSDKRLALAAYARRLGLASGEKSPPAPVTNCGAPQPPAIAASKPSRHGHRTAALETPVIPPAPLATTSPSLAATTSTLPSLAATPSALPPLTPVAVRVSEVHAVPQAPAIDPVHAASTCLTVDSDGSHWGFRNGCAYDVRVAWCLKDAGSDPASCDKGPEGGLVAAKSFAPLTLANVLGGNDIEHRFRWVACGLVGPALEARLDTTSPPSGRCIAPPGS